MELMNMGITKNEEKFREHLKQYHPNKYHMFIITKKEEPIDSEIKFFPMVHP
jgi:hypothetical protein